MADYPPATAIFEEMCVLASVADAESHPLGITRAELPLIAAAEFVTIIADLGEQLPAEWRARLIATGAQFMRINRAGVEREAATGVMLDRLGIGEDRA